MSDVGLTISEIERYWLEAGIPKDAVAEMGGELAQHLADAAADGRTVADVVGADPGEFAESWAMASRGSRIPPVGKNFAPERQPGIGPTKEICICTE